MNPTAVFVCVLVVTLPALGCPGCLIIGSPSGSFADSSKSIGGSFDGISTSSGSTVVSLTPNRQGFERDLREFTARFAATAGGLRQDFLRGVTRIAEDHGISDWESDAVTPRASARACATPAFAAGDGRVRRRHRPRAPRSADRARRIPAPRKLIGRRSLGLTRTVEFSSTSTPESTRSNDTEMRLAAKQQVVRSIRARDASN
jgi:hypothetical protein